MSCHGFYKSSISTFILTCLSALVPYYFSKGFLIFETEEVGVDSISISVKMQIHTDNLYQEDSLLTRKAAIPPIVDKLRKIIIAKYVFNTYVYNV